MDFAAYVEARRTSLVRAAVLLGHPPTRAAAAVDTVLVTRGRAIGRSDHPDPEVHAALARELGPPPAHPEPAPDGDGAEVRDALLHLDPTSRAVAVLVLHADLTAREIAAALGLKPAEVAEPLARAVAALGVTEEIDARERLALAADTIAVPPLTSPLEPAPADRRPWLAAVAVLVVVGLTTALLARGGDGADAPDPSPGGRPGPVALRLRHHQRPRAPGEPRAGRQRGAGPGLRAGRPRRRQQAAHGGAAARRQHGHDLHRVPRELLPATLLRPPGRLGVHRLRHRTRAGAAVHRPDRRGRRRPGTRSR